MSCTFNFKWSGQNPVDDKVHSAKGVTRPQFKIGRLSGPNVQMSGWKQSFKGTEQRQTSGTMSSLAKRNMCHFPISTVVGNHPGA